MRVHVPSAFSHGWAQEPGPAPAGRSGALAAHIEVHAAQDQHLPGRPLPVPYTLLLSILVVIATVYGLVLDDAYRLVPDLTRATWRAQDAVTLASVPVLLMASWRARAGSLSAHLVSVGILIWLTYGYAHMSIGTPFNAMFLVYVSVLVLSGFGMLDGLLRVDVVATAPAFTRAPRRAAAWFLAVAGAGIAVLWLSEIVVALPDGLPTNIHLGELPNPTWVLDLGWIIPSAIAAAALLRKRHPAGPIVAGAMLVMLLILSVSMLAVVPFALIAGLDSDPQVGPQLVVFAALFSVLGAIEAWLLARGRPRLGFATPLWLRRGWWPGMG